MQFDRTTGYVYVAETNAAKVRRLVGAGSSYSLGTVVGSGWVGRSTTAEGSALTQNVSNPVGLALDGNGDLLISDPTSLCVRRLVNGTGWLTTAAGDCVTGWASFSGDGGPATSARLDYPKHMALAGDGVSVLLLDGPRVRKLYLDPSPTATRTSSSSATGTPEATASVTNTGSTAETSSPSQTASLTLSFGATPSNTGSVPPSSSGSCSETETTTPTTTPSQFPSLTALAATGTRAQSPSPLPSRTGLPYKITTIAGTGVTDRTAGDGGLATQASFNEPQGIAADSAGMIYVSEKDGHRVRRIDPAGNIRTWVGTAALPVPPATNAGAGAEGGTSLVVTSRDYTRRLNTSTLKT